jgi:valyl-tRNA synthetase
MNYRRLSFKSSKLREDVFKQEELINRGGFDKVSDVVLAAEENKLKDARAVVQNFERTTKQFKNLEV